MVVSQKEMAGLGKIAVSVPIEPGEACWREPLHGWLDSPRKRQIVISVATKSISWQLIGRKVFSLELKHPLLYTGSVWCGGICKDLLSSHGH